MKKTCAVLLLGLSPSLSNAQQDGMWEVPFAFGPEGGPFTRAINLVHVWNGSAAKVLALSGDFPDSRFWTPPPVGGPPGYSGVFEPADVDSFTFCGGHSALADGRVLHVGGVYVNHADLFNPWAPVGTSGTTRSHRPT